jgi:hypothetical protein
VNVAVAPLTERVPSTELTVKDVEVTVAGSTALEKVTVTVVDSSTSVAPWAGLTCVTARGTGVSSSGVSSAHAGSVGLHAGASVFPHAVPNAATNTREGIHVKREYRMIVSW